MKFIQIAAAENLLWALADDGTIWRTSAGIFHQQTWVPVALPTTLPIPTHTPSARLSCMVRGQPFSVLVDESPNV